MFGGRILEPEAFGILLLNSRTKYDYAMNSKYLFMWDRKKIEFYDLKIPMIKENKLLVNFKISNSQKNAYIKSVVPGNDPDKIAIVVD